jgi:CheY-like chemotaxis protein
MHTILVVDDRLESRYVTVRTLASRGYDVRETATGSAALQLLSMRPDLVVLDVSLPDIDGFEVCRQIKAQPSGRRIPVVMKTAVYRDKDSERQGFASGADAYLMDPVAPEQLLSTIDTLLKPPQS